MPFFEVCVPCRMSFSSEKEYEEHLSVRHGVEKKKDSASVLQNIPSDSFVVPKDAARASEEDARLAKAKSLRIVKKKLLHAGIECATMTQGEAMAAYEKAVKSGKIKESSKK